jgi:hypothetical protein
MELVLALLAISALVVIGRAVFGSGVTVDDLLRRTDLAWPRGVQEEEPAPWRLDRLAASGRAERQLHPQHGRAAGRA